MKTIQIQIQINSNNLIVIMKAFPLVEIEYENGTESENIKNLNQENLFHIEIQKVQTMMEFKKMGK